DVVLGTREGHAALGVTLQDDLSVKPPFRIDIDSGQVVGPSAGLAYGLELLDVLTPGELTGGAPVVATGQLTFDGHVVPIGGGPQKAITVRRAGVHVFIVPRANYNEVKRYASSSL